MSWRLGVHTLIQRRDVNTAHSNWLTFDVQELIDYYNVSTPRDWTGRVKSFEAKGRIGNGLRATLHKSAPQVALFSARGPNIKDYSFRDADLLKPDILAPGALIWAAWAPHGTDEPNYEGKTTHFSLCRCL